MSRQPLRVLYVGTYEREYPRNALVIAALRRAGFDVRELHAPVWERRRDKVAGFHSPVSWLLLAATLIRAYVTLVGRTMFVLRGADVAIVGYIGQLDMLVLAPLIRLLRRPVIFNPLVTLTDTLVDDRGLVGAGTRRARAVETIDRMALARAHAVLVDTPENGRYLVERLGVAPRRIHQLDVGADDRMFDPNRVEPPRSDGPLQVLFYGKFTPLQGVDTILRAAHLLDDGAFAFTLIGTGQTCGAARALAIELALTNVVFVDWVPYAELPGRIASADVVLGIFGDTAKATRVVPNKVFQAMSMGAAIATADTPAVRRVLHDERSALLVPPADPAELAAAIRRLADRDHRRTLGEGARAAFDEVGSIDALARRLVEVLPAATAPYPRAEPAWVRR